MKDLQTVYTRPLTDDSEYAAKYFSKMEDYYQPWIFSPAEINKALPGRTRLLQATIYFVKRLFKNNGYEFKEKKQMGEGYELVFSKDVEILTVGNSLVGDSGIEEVTVTALPFDLVKP